MCRRFQRLCGDTFAARYCLLIGFNCENSRLPKAQDVGWKPTEAGYFANPEIQSVRDHNVGCLAHFDGGFAAGVNRSLRTTLSLRVSSTSPALGTTANFFFGVVLENCFASAIEKAPRRWFLEEPRELVDVL